MELIERTGYLHSLQEQFDKMLTGEGHTVFVSGEAGIGKTSLLKAFCKKQKNNCVIYQGACDALFTPRPLAPLFDIGWQIRNDFWQKEESTEDRTALFSRVFQELNNLQEPVILLFEDIHWADEATLDFIKFLARRISRLRCLFILTYRDDEIHSNHPFKTVPGQLPPDSFSRMQLAPLSKTAVDQMAAERGYSGEDVYSISGGNPFYVTEILASYSFGIPENIKDAILSVYNSIPEETRQVWDLLSVNPSGLEVDNLLKAEPHFSYAIENCMEKQIIILKNGVAHFKHELYRRTVEKSMSPFRRIALNKKILDLMLPDFEMAGQIERIIHHAKNANDYDCVVKYAPVAAKHAAAVGAHIEASKLYYTAIEYYQGKDRDLLIQFYESYAYECYLTNQVRNAIIYQARSLTLRREKHNNEETGNCLRFLSRLWWFEGNRKQAESYGEQAIEILDKEPMSKAKAMAYSNMSQLKMLSDQLEECVYWGEKAIALSKELNDEATLSHALNNVGAIQMRNAATHETGAALLKESLDIALKNSYHEHAARAYTNLGSQYTLIKQFAIGEKYLEEGVQYCEERDLGLWSKYMLSWKARVSMEKGNWEEAATLAGSLLQNEDQPTVNKFISLSVAATISMRCGNNNPLPQLLECKTKGFETKETQRIVPAMTALLEYEWIHGTTVLDQELIDRTIQLVKEQNNSFQNSPFVFWLWMVRGQSVDIPELFEGYKANTPAAVNKAANTWKKIGCPYEQALVLYNGTDADKKNAIAIVHQLGATLVYNKMKQEMRKDGIKSIPRGIRTATRENPAFLTSRQLDILQLLNEGLQNKEIGSRLYISAKTVDHHISAILFKLDVNSRVKAVQEAQRLGIIK